MTNPQTWFCRNRYKNSHLNRQIYRCELFYLCSCLSTQFLYRTAVKATFNVKDNINNIIKNSITLTINPTRLSYDESYNIGWQNRSTNYQFPMFIILQYYLKSVYNVY